MSGAAALKRQAAEAALADVSSGMRVGLGSGSTARIMVELLGDRVRAGLRVVGVPTSEGTAALAREVGITLAELADVEELDLTIDGADEVNTATLDLIKGLGGALVREKIVAAASKRMTVIVDSSKLVPRLGGVRLPVEVVRFAWQATDRHLRRLGAETVLREGGDGAPFVTDNGNHILDCRLAIDDPQGIDRAIGRIPGVVETGLFIGMATKVVVGTQDGPHILERE